MAVPPLRALAGAGHDVALCVTRPDRRRGRGAHVTPSPVKEAATELGITVTHDMDDVAAAGVELAVVVAYGRIIPARLLAQVPMVNLHFSLLPRWRGAAPVERAILAGDHETGVCLMKVEEGLDTGPVYAVRSLPLDDDVTLAALRERLVALGSSAPRRHARHRRVRVARARAPAGRGHDRGQDHAGGPPPRMGGARRPAQARRASRAGLDHVPGQAVDRARRRSRARRPGTPACRRPARSSGPAVATGDGTLVLRQVQPESRSPMSADEWLRGVRPGAGERLGTD